MQRIGRRCGCGIASSCVVWLSSRHVQNFLRPSVANVALYMGGSRQLSVYDASFIGTAFTYKVLFRTIFPEILTYRFVSGCWPIIHRCIIFVRASKIQDYMLPLCSYAVTCLSIFWCFREPNELQLLLPKNSHWRCDTTAYLRRCGCMLRSESAAEEGEFGLTAHGTRKRNTLHICWMQQNFQGPVASTSS